MKKAQINKKSIKIAFSGTIRLNESEDSNRHYDGGFSGVCPLRDTPPRGSRAFRPRRTKHSLLHQRAKQFDFYRIRLCTGGIFRAGFLHSCRRLFNSIEGRRTPLPPTQALNRVFF